MKEFRIDVFYGIEHEKHYFDNKVEAILFGQEQLSRSDIAGVFLFRLVSDQRYDMVCAIE